MQLPFDLHKLHYEDVQNIDHPSVFMVEKEYGLLIVRLPKIEKEFMVTSYVFVIHNNHSYYYERQTNKFVNLGFGFEGLYKMLDEEVDSVIDLLASIHENIVQSEEMLYINSSNDFLRSWFEQKKELIRIHRLTLKCTEILYSFLNYYKSDKNFLHNEFEDIIEHLDRSERSSQSGLLKLDQIYSFYSVRTGERMNQSIYYLTIISAIFLPLNLAVGFFGMNTGGLPFAEVQHGTLLAVTSMLCTTIILITAVAIYLRRRNS